MVAGTFDVAAFAVGECLVLSGARLARSVADTREYLHGPVEVPLGVVDVAKHARGPPESPVTLALGRGVGDPAGAPSRDALRAFLVLVAPLPLQVVADAGGQ